MREVMTALLVMNLSQSKEVKRTKPVKKLPRVTRCISQPLASSSLPSVDNFYPRRLLGGVVSTVVVFTHDFKNQRPALTSWPSWHGKGTETDFTATRDSLITLAA